MLRNQPRWRIVFVLGSFLVLSCLIVFFLWYQLFTWPDRQGAQLAALMATDDTLAEFGDGSYLVPIPPSAAYQVGVPITLDNLCITVTKSEESTNYQGAILISEDYTFWAVEFTLENISNETLDVNPRVDSQMQYFRDSSYHRDLGFATTDPTLQQGVITIAPQTQFQGTLIYEVPKDVAELFWVYKRVVGHMKYSTEYMIFKVK